MALYHQGLHQVAGFPPTAAGFEEVQEEKVEVLLKHLTSPFKQFPHPLITFQHKSLLRRRIQEELLREIRPSIPTAGLGDLGKLPVELILMVLRYLDIVSLLSLHQVNRFSRDLVHTLKHWRILMSSHEVINALRALILCEIASYFTLEDLYHALLSKACIECGSPAPLLFLPKLARACSRCLGVSRQLSLSNLRGNRYSAGHLEKIRKHGLVVFVSALEGYNNDGTRRRKRNLLMRDDFARPDIPGIGKATQIKWHSRPTDITGTFNATIMFPYLSQEDMKIKGFLKCRGCYMSTRPEVVTSEDYLEHFRRCFGARSAWAAKQMELKRKDKVWEGIQNMWGWFQNLWEEF